MFISFKLPISYPKFNSQQIIENQNSNSTPNKKSPIKSTKKKTRKLPKLPNVRITISRDRGLIGTGDGRVNALATAVNHKSVAFGGESLGGVVVDGGLDGGEGEKTNKSQSREARH